MRGRFSIAFGFLALITVGAILLSSPLARTAGAWGDWSSGAFTACSAVCVTGLSVVDIGAEYTRFGQIVLMALVELGALGLMTLGTFLLVAIGRRLSFASEFSLMNAYGVAEIRGVRGLVTWIVGSMVVKAFQAINRWVGFEMEILRIENYIAIVLKTIIAFGLVFQVPLVLFVLGWFGIITSKTLREKRRVAIVLAFFLSMFLTPPDPMSQIFMAVPLCVLYEISIWAIWLKEKGSFK